MRITWRFQSTAIAGALVVGALTASLGCELDHDAAVDRDAVGLRPTLELVFVMGPIASAVDYAPPRYGEEVETKDYLTGVTNAPLVTWAEPEWP